MPAPDPGLPRRLRNRRERQASGLHLLEGVPAWLHACDTGADLVAIFHSNVLLRSATAQKLVRHRKREGVPTRHLTPERFRRLSADTRASGILAVARQRWSPLGSLPVHGTTGLLVLEGIRVAGNLGTILRTAEAAGVAGVAFLPPHHDPYDVAVVRASMGSVFDLTLVRTGHRELADWADATGVTLVGTSPRGEEDHTTLSRADRAAVLVGAEREGLSPQAQALCHRMVRIPILGRGDSLNVAVATGIVLYRLLDARSGVR